MAIFFREPALKHAAVTLDQHLVMSQKALKPLPAWCRVHYRRPTCGRLLSDPVPKGQPRLDSVDFIVPNSEIIFPQRRAPHSLANIQNKHHYTYKHTLQTKHVDRDTGAMAQFTSCLSRVCYSELLLLMGRLIISLELFGD